MVQSAHSPFFLIPGKILTFSHPPIFHVSDLIWFLLPSFVGFRSWLHSFLFSSRGPTFFIEPQRPHSLRLNPPRSKNFSQSLLLNLFPFCAITSFFPTGDGTMRTVLRDSPRKTYRRSLPFRLPPCSSAEDRPPPSFPGPVIFPDVPRSPLSLLFLSKFSRVYFLIFCKYARVTSSSFFKEIPPSFCLAAFSAFLGKLPDCFFSKGFFAPVYQFPASSEAFNLCIVAPLVFQHLFHLLGSPFLARSPCWHNLFWNFLLPPTSGFDGRTFLYDRTPP